MVRILVPLAGLLLCSTALGQAKVGPAPGGDAVRVAHKVIVNNGHACPKVLSATRRSDGSIKAECSNGEDYRVFSINGDPLSMKCSAARKLGVSGC